MTRLGFAMLFLSRLMFAGDAVYDGAKVHYESYGTGTDALVFIHGWTCDLTFWRGQAPVYTKHRSLLIDLPGHGQSGKPDVAYTLERFARGVEAAMRDAGVERAVLIGHSMGEPVSLTFLRLFPAKVKALVSVDGFLPAVPKNEQERAKRKSDAEAYGNEYRKESNPEATAKMIDSMFTDRTTAVQRDEIRTKMLAAPRHVRVSAMAGMVALEPPTAAEKYGIPSLFIVAGRPERKGYDARVRALFPGAAYEEWAGYGHFLMMEDAPRFNARLEKFLASLDAARP